MHFEPDQIYHVYNRGNDKQPVFFSEANYLYFLSKIKTEWKKHADVLCYCLMPNHFHFMLVPNKEGCKNIILAGKDTHMQNLSKAIGKTLSSYTKAVNLQNKTIGNLFQKKTKAKLLTETPGIKNVIFTNREYILTCFHYIHQNPLQAGLVSHLKDWPFSSYPDYYDRRDGAICNKPLTLQLLELSENDFENCSNSELNDGIIKGIF
jgi:putative transposase